MSDSGVLDFLEGTKHIKLIAKVDDKTVEVTASSEVESAERARQMEKGFSLLIVGGRIAKRGKDEELYYNHTQVSSNEKEVSVKFAIPRSELSHARAALPQHYSDQFGWNEIVAGVAGAWNRIPAADRKNCGILD